MPHEILRIIQQRQQRGTNGYYLAYLRICISSLGYCLASGKIPADNLLMYSVHQQISSALLWISLAIPWIYWLLLKWREHSPHLVKGMRDLGRRSRKEICWRKWW